MKFGANWRRAPKKLEEPPLRIFSPKGQLRKEKENTQMLLSATGNKEFERIPADTHVAICYTIADLGTQKGTFKGETKNKRQIVFIWETPQTLMEDGRPFAVSKRYTASLYPGSNLRDHLESWRGSGFTEEEEVAFDPIAFLMKPCLLGVMNESKDGKTYTNISSVQKLPNGFPAPKGFNAPVYFSLEDFNQTAFESLPNWVQDKIKLSPEYKAVQEGNPVGESYGAHTSESGTTTRTVGQPAHGEKKTDQVFNTEDLLTEDDIPF